MGARPSNRELLERIFRQLDEQDARAAARHEIIAREIEDARARDERVRREYAELESSVASAKERFVRSEKIFVDAMGEISLDMKRHNERLDDMGAEIRANTHAVLSVLDRLEPPSA